MMQAASDIYLGWTKGAEANRYLYWRQLRDMKGSAVVEAMAPLGLTFYARSLRPNAHSPLHTPDPETQSLSPHISARRTALTSPSPTSPSATQIRTSRTTAFPRRSEPAASQRSTACECRTRGSRSASVDQVVVEGGATRATRHRFHGHMPSISTSSEKLNTTLMTTMIPKTATLWTDWSTTIVRMMSAMMSTSRPSRITRPRFLRSDDSVSFAMHHDVDRESCERSQPSDDQDRRPDCFHDVDHVREEVAVGHRDTLDRVRRIEMPSGSVGVSVGDKAGSGAIPMSRSPSVARPNLATGLPPAEWDRTPTRRMTSGCRYRRSCR